MAMLGDQGADVFDVIVVGSGIGGLTPAALLAKAGMKVLVVEQHDAPGGYAHVFRRGPYVFDPAVHAVPDRALFDGLLAYLGVRDRCVFLDNEHFFTLRFPDFRLDLPLEREGFIAAHVERFPEHAAAIRRFFQTCLVIHREAHDLPPHVALRDLDQVAARFPMVFKYFHATVGDALDEFLAEPCVKAVCGALAWYTGLPPSRMSLQTYAQMLGNHLAEGSFYCRGSFQNLIDAIVVGVQRHGGQVRFGNGARRILVDEGRVAGVELEDGWQARAQLVISNADPTHTFEDLVGVERLPAPYVRRLRRLRTSLTSCVLYAATDLDLAGLGATPESYVYRSWDHDENYCNIGDGRFGAMWVTVPTLVDPSLAPSGEHLVIASMYLPYELPWRQEKARYTDLIIAELAALFPGLREHLTFAESATPPALERFTRNRRGAIYAWENTPDQTGSRRLAHRTPLDGLYLSGHWTVSGSGFLRACVSGMHVAQLILADTGRHEALAALQFPHLPPAM